MDRIPQDHLRIKTEFIAPMGGCNSQVPLLLGEIGEPSAGEEYNVANYCCCDQLMLSLFLFNASDVFPS